MRFISTRTHGLLDYPVGILMLLAPTLWGIGDTPRVILMVVGVGILLMSALTDYPLGVYRKIRFEAHRVIDILTAVLLIGAPWMFGFSAVDSVRNAFLGFGTFILLTSFMTSTAGAESPEIRHRHA